MPGHRPVLDFGGSLGDVQRGPEEEFTLASEVVAIEDRTAMVRVRVEYVARESSRWRDLWVLRFTEDGRCSSCEEWFFAPGQAAPAESLGR